MKRKVQLDHISGLSSLEVLEAFTDVMEPIFVGGMQLSVEDLLAHLDLIPPSSGGSGTATYEYLQQYIMELDESGKL